MNYQDTPQSACRFGIARGDITPPAGIYHRMWGAAVHDRAEGVHRPLTATAMVFQPLDGPPGCEARQVVLAVDHCLLGSREIDLLLDRVSRSGRVERQALLVAFSHTHAAGLMTLDRRELPGGELIEGYLGQLGTRLGELVAAAIAGLQPAVLTYGTGRCDLAANRDLWDPALGQYVCGYNPAEAADDTVLVARVTGARDQQPLATVVNYACHPTTLAWDNRLVSPDYPGAMRELIEQATGVPCVFLQGASGELGPREGFVGDVQVAERNGRQLGYAALSALTALPPPGTRFQYAGAVVSGATIGTWDHVPLPDQRHQQVAHWQLRRWTVPLAYRPGLARPEQVRQERDRWQAEEQAARQRGDDQQARDARAMAERNTRLLARLGGLPPGDHFPLPVILWRMGDALWLAVEGEYYSLLQRTLRQRFPHAPVLVTTVVNSWRPAYLPPAELYGKGIYQESVAILAAGSLEQLIDHVARQIEHFSVNIGN